MFKFVRGWRSSTATGGDEGLREQLAASASPRKVGAGSAHCPPLLALAGTRFPASQHIPRHSPHHPQAGVGDTAPGCTRRCSLCWVTGAGTPLAAYIHPHLNFHHHYHHHHHQHRRHHHYQPLLTPSRSVSPRSTRTCATWFSFAALRSPGDAGPRPETSCSPVFFTFSRVCLW